MSRWPVAAACSLAGLFGSIPSIPHDWYPLDCCSNKDCRALVEINGETVLEVPEGWRQGKRMKVCDPIAGALSGRARAPKPCGTQQRAGSQSRLLTDLRHK